MCFWKKNYFTISKGFKYTSFFLQGILNFVQSIKKTPSPFFIYGIQLSAFFGSIKTTPVWERYQFACKWRYCLILCIKYTEEPPFSQKPVDFYSLFKKLFCIIIRSVRKICLFRVMFPNYLLLFSKLWIKNQKD